MNCCHVWREEEQHKGGRQHHHFKQTAATTRTPHPPYQHSDCSSPQLKTLHLIQAAHWLTPAAPTFLPESTLKPGQQLVQQQQVKGSNKQGAEQRWQAEAQVSCSSSPAANRDPGPEPGLLPAPPPSIHRPHPAVAGWQGIQHTSSAIIMIPQSTLTHRETGSPLSLRYKECEWDDAQYSDEGRTVTRCRCQAANAPLVQAALNFGHNALTDGVGQPTPAVHTRGCHSHTPCTLSTTCV